jgi:predicted transcriptional regulator
MSAIKDQLAKIISEQPDDSSREEIIRELIFSSMIERGIADSEAGRTISNEEMQRRIRTWRN